MVTTDLKYSTTEDFGEILGIISKIPSWEIGGTPTNEEVGTGDNTEQILYLNNQNIINLTQTLFYGADATATDILIETTDYLFDLDTGKITLTTDGATKVGVNKIFASYSYFNNGMSDSYLTKVLIRAEKEVDGKINANFTDSSTTNPAYTQKIETQSSPGYFRNQIIVANKPLIDIESTLDGAVDDSQETIDLATGIGATFPSSGYIIVDAEVMSYSGITDDQLTGVVRAKFDSSAAEHDDASEVHSTVLLLSNSPEGNAVIWTAQPWNTQMHASDSGLVYSFAQSVFEPSQYPDRLTTQDVADRVKIIYYTGYSDIPEDITRLSLLLGKRQLIQDSVGKALIAGRDEFNPEMFNVDKDEIMSIVNDYIVLPMGNT